jgi:hypothetical protein
MASLHQEGGRSMRSLLSPFSASARSTSARSTSAISIRAGDRPGVALVSTCICVVLSAAVPGVAWAQDDTDGDGIPDAIDSCPEHVNGTAEDSDGDGVGDVCDPDTINALLESTPVGGGPVELHARTPWYRLRVSAANGLEIDAEGGLGATPTPGIGVSAIPPAVRIQPVDFFGLGGGYAPGAATPVQSSWQSIVLESVFAAGVGGPPPIRGFVSTHANGASIGYELPLSSIPIGDDVGIGHDVVLASGWTLDASEVTAGGGVGRITLRDGGGVARLRISAVEVIAHGSDTVIADSASFHGLQRVVEELASSVQTASVGPADLVGADVYGGIHAPLVETAYTVETLKDAALGTISVTPIGGTTWRISMIAPAAIVDRNRATSSHVFLGWRVSTLGAVDLGTGAPGAPAATVHCRHLCFFDDEAVVSGTENVIRVHNDIGTFDGAAPDYTLFPDDGGSAADYDVLSQQQAALGCAGCTMALSGTTLVEFPGGGVGMGIGPGPRVGPADPCVASDPLNESAGTGRCAVGKSKRGVFSAEELELSGSMSGLVAGESDVSVASFTFLQRHDPNVTDPTLLHGVMGIGCAAEAGVRIGVNPSNGDVLGNVPLDLSTCAPDDIGAGFCRPPALASPPGTGICNVAIDSALLTGLGSVANPYMDTTLPSGVGIALHMRGGSARIGDLAWDPGSNGCTGTYASEPSSVRGFEVMASVSGGANVAETTGEPMAYDDAGAVPPTVFCVSNVLGDELVTGLVVGGNADVRADHLQIEETLLGAIQASNGGANLEDVASTTLGGTPCPTVDSLTCRTPIQELACPGCKQGGEHFAASISAGLSASTGLEVTNSVIGLDEAGYSAGRSASLPSLVLGEDLVATGGGLTFGRRLAGLLSTPIQLAWGPDTLFEPGLFVVDISDSVIGTDVAAISLDNFDSPGGVRDLTLGDNCYTNDGTTCITDTTPGAIVVGAAAPEPEVIDTNGDALEDASDEPNMNAGLVPEPGSAIGLASGFALILGLARRRRRRERGATHA